MKITTAIINKPFEQLKVLGNGERVKGFEIENDSIVYVLNIREVRIATLDAETAEIIKNKVAAADPIFTVRTNHYDDITNNEIAKAWGLA